jgi:hypothetical protein
VVVTPAPRIELAEHVAIAKLVFLRPLAAVHGVLGRVAGNEGRVRFAGSEVVHDGLLYA